MAQPLAGTLDAEEAALHPEIGRRVDDGLDPHRSRSKGASAQEII
jgi:hypothetical protein